VKSDGYISAPDAIWKLFKVRLSEHKAFKDLTYSFIRNRSEGKSFLDSKEELQSNAGANLRNNHFIHKNSLTKLYNAIILQAFFIETKKVKAIFSNPKMRKRAVDLMAVILKDRQCILGITLQPSEVEVLLNVMNSDASLDTVRLPNPFSELPQLSLSGMTSVTQALIAQSASLSQGSSMMLHFFNGDLEEAYQASCLLNPTDPVLKKYCSLVQQQYHEATEFDNLLDDLLN